MHCSIVCIAGKEEENVMHCMHCSIAACFKSDRVAI